MCFSCFGRLLFNDKYTIRTQILVSYSLIIIISAGITLGICYGILFGAGTSSYEVASNTIIVDTKSSCLTYAQEISSAISQQLQIVGQSVCQGGALYAATLFNAASTKSTTLAPFPSYRDYNFKVGCLPPLCPTDFGPFGTKTRIPPHTNYTNGSITFTSTYLYSSSLKMSARNASAWNATMHKFPDAYRAELALSYQDLDMRVNYFKGSNATIFYYLSTQITSSSGAYASVHRTFPGVNKASDPRYNPPSRPWFQHAPVNAVYLYGPYIETFTRLPVVTLSSKETVSGTQGLQDTIVSAAVIQLSTLIQIVGSVQYPDGGFGAVVTYHAPYTVLAWGNISAPYNHSTGKFTTIADYAPSILSNNIQQQNTFDYTNQSGVQYIVASVPFFLVSDGAVPYSTSSYSLIMLVFSRRDKATAPLASLQANINTTTTSVTTKTIIIIVVVAVAVMILVWLLVLWMTSPLLTMRRISDKLVQAAAEEDEKKDYTGIVQDAFFAQTKFRKDELGALTSEYFRVVCMLHNKSVEKRQIPKYPDNPFYLPDSTDFSRVTWIEIVERAANVLASGEKSVTQTAVQSKLSQLPVSGNGSSFNSGSELDVLGDLMAHRPVQPPIHAVSLAPSTPLNYSSVVPAHEAVIIVKPEKVPMPESVQAVPGIASLRTKLYCISLVLLLGLLAVMVVTAIQLRSDGSQWMTQTSADLETAQISSINSIASVKAVFLQSNFKQMSADTNVGAQVVSLIMNFNLTSKGLLNTTGHYLQSYAIDPNDPYRFSTSTTSYYTVSSYFYSVWAQLKCYSLNTQKCSRHFNQLNETRQVSLTDLRLTSYFYSGNYLASVQVGLQDSGQIRAVPYTSNSGYAQPTQCYVQDTSTSACASKYQTSACNPSSGINTYPPYDPRCRVWYNQARQRADPTKAYFQYPRQSSDSGFVISSVAPLRQFGETGGSLLGAITFNFNAQTLSNNVNALRILGSGYSYLIDGTNTSRLVLHPYASQYCVLVHCAEGFTATEYQQFVNTVLAPLQANTLAQASGSSTPQQAVAGAYYKQGQRWILAYSEFNEGTIQYVVIVTVSEAAIKQSAADVQSEIDSTTNGMIAAIAIAMVFFCITLYYMSRCLVNAVVPPIEQLTSVLKRAAADDLTGQIPGEAQSFDLKVLLKAFSDLMVALRFGSDSYARGNVSLALTAFTDALTLYQASGNLRGEASAHNNIGAAELQLKHLELSRVHFEASLRLGEELLAQLDKDGMVYDAIRLRRVLSDRRGNLAVLLLEEKRSADAYDLLEQLLISDRDQGYVMGMVIKQGTLGHNFLQQGELGSAERVFTSALQFTRAGVTESAIGGAGWSPEEACAAEQVALYNMSCLRSAQKRNAEAMQLLLESLSRGRVMHTQTANKVLVSLQVSFKQAGNTEFAESVARLAAACGFVSKPTVGAIKRVVFVVDYSGSMAGSKIRTAVDNMTSITEMHLYNYDSVALIHFTNKVSVDLPMTRKEGNEARVMAAIASLTRPEGATALYDAVYNAKIILDAGSTDQDWIVALTDGGDNSSSMSLAQLKEHLSGSHVHAIVLGIGGDVETALLQQVAAATSKGLYIGAAGDKASIDNAFGQVVAAIQGQLVMED